VHPTTTQCAPGITIYRSVNNDIDDIAVTIRMSTASDFGYTGAPVVYIVTSRPMNTSCNWVNLFMSVFSQLLNYSARDDGSL